MLHLRPRSAVAVPSGEGGGRRLRIRWRHRLSWVLNRSNLVEDNQLKQSRRRL